MNLDSPHPTRTLIWLAAGLRGLLWLLLLAWGLFALSWGVLHTVIVPRIGDWRPGLERVATQALGVTVRIGEIRAESTGFVPAFELSDVRLLDAEGRQALHLPRVRSALSATSLWRLGFEQLVIESPTLDVRRTAEGQLLVAGLALSAPSDETGSRLADWLLAQPEWAIRHGRLRWTDESRPQAPPLELSDVELVVRNPGRQHAMRLDATPPPGWGERFTLRGQFRQPLWVSEASRWDEWSGSWFADLPQLDVQRLRQYLDTQPLLGLEVRQGLGGVRLWGELRQGGHLSGLTADLALASVELQVAQAPAALAVQDLQARLQLQQDAQWVALATEGLRFRTPDGLVWPGGNLRWRQQRQTADTATAPPGSVQAEALDLGVMHQLAARLPLPAGWHAQLQSLQPQGRVEQITLSWSAQGWQADGRVSGLALAPGPVEADQASPTAPLGRPGLSRADVVFQATDRGGQASLALREGTLVFPGVFEDPVLGFRQLDAAARWQINGEALAVELEQLRFVNADVEGSAQGRWQTADPARSGSGSRFPGVLDLQASLSRAQAQRVHRYLPLEMPADVRHYVRDAVRQGEARDARFVVKGDLWDFPFASPQQGTFEVRARLQGVGYDYMPAALLAPGDLPWPALEQVGGELRIQGNRFQIGQAQARVRGLAQLRAEQVQADIADLSADTPVLALQARVLGPAADALQFVDRSPLRQLTADALRPARATGAVDVPFTLQLPLQDTPSVRLKGQVRLVRNDLRLHPDAPWLMASTGTVDFDEQGFRVAQASTRVLGGELRFSGGSTLLNGVRGVQFQGQGQASADGLRALADTAGWGALARRLQGSTNYRVQLGVGEHGPDLRVDANLMGLGWTLPAPLQKTAPQLLPLKLEWQALPPLPGRDMARDRLLLELGQGEVPVLSAHYERTHSPLGLVVQRGTLAVNSPRPPWPEQGIQAQLTLGDVDVSAWEQVLGGDATQGAGPLGDSRAYWPTSFGLSALTLRQDGRTFHDVVAGGSREADTWRLNVNARELNGYLEYRTGSTRQPGRLYGRLARLHLPPSSADDIERLLQAPTVSLPALDIVIDEFQLDQRALGRLEIDAVNRGASLAGRPAAREWRLNTFNLTVPEAQLLASGQWSELGPALAAPGGGRAPARRTALTLRLNIEDSGALLARFGMPGVLRGGKGEIGGTLGWLGSPMALHHPSLNGTLEVALQRGQFLKAEPGIAKLLGVLSLQSLPRRLALDFRDVFSEGFAFDFVRGNVRIAQGIASTNNLQMKGVNAAVLLEGQADLARETQEITAVVVPELNAGTAALVATAINPAVGLGSFLAQFLLGKPLQDAATQQFRITGPWADPQVLRLERRNIEPTPTITPGVPQ